MLIIMNPDATSENLEKVLEYIKSKGLRANVAEGKIQNVVGVLGENLPDKHDFELMSGVSEVIRVTSGYKLASRAFKKEDTVVEANGCKFGGQYCGIIAGPCAIETEEQVDKTAKALSEFGVKLLRGGAFKPRTSPYSFCGLGEEGLKIIRKVADKYSMGTVTEVTNPAQIPLMLGYVDIFQVGARNMQNFDLLRALGKINKPVILKRGLAATIEEWLMAAEYILSEGNPNVILCERGIRTFERITRNTLDLCAIPVIKKLSHLPVIVDPSHGTGLRDKIAPMSKAAVAAGCDGLITEVHDNPEKALCDGAQSLYPEQFGILYDEVKQIGKVVKRVIN